MKRSRRPRGLAGEGRAHGRGRAGAIPAAGDHRPAGRARPASAGVVLGLGGAAVQRSRRRQPVRRLVGDPVHHRAAADHPQLRPRQWLRQQRERRHAVRSRGGTERSDLRRGESRVRHGERPALIVVGDRIGRVPGLGDPDGGQRRRHLCQGLAAGDAHLLAPAVARHGVVPAVYGDPHTSATGSRSAATTRSAPGWHCSRSRWCRSGCSGLRRRRCWCAKVGAVAGSC